MWCLNAFGTPLLSEDSASPRSVRLTAHDAFLLAIVLLDGPLPRSRVLDLLWPQAATAAAAYNNLRQRLHRLRRATGARLVEADDSVRAAADLCVPALAVPRRPEAGAQAGPGSFLGGVDAPNEELEAWRRDVRARLDQQHSDHLERLAASAEAEGDFDRALAHARARLAGDPASEAAHQRVIRLHYLRGDRASALDAFAACERQLAHHAGRAPSAPTAELLVLIRATALRSDGPLPQRPAVLVRPPRLIGRDDILQTLAQAWADRRAVLLTGEGGIGKTRLLQEFLASRHAVVFARSRPDDRHSPFESLARLLRGLLAQGAAPDAAVLAHLARVLPELGPPAQPGEQADEQTALTTAIQHFLCACAGQGLEALVIDDLQFTDAASLRLLGRLVTATHEHGLRWWLAGRGGPGAELAAFEADLAVALPLVRIGLRPLGPGQLSELVQSLGLPQLGAADIGPELFRHAGGNPFFVLETLAHHLTSAAGDERLPAPPAVVELIDRRMQRLSSPALQLARVAALAGEDFSVPMAEALLQVGPLQLADPWRELEQAGLFSGEAFAHDLAHEGVLRTIPEAVARRCHAQVAEYLAARPGAHAARLAWHWDCAGSHEQAGRGYLAAAADAHARSLPSRELQFLAQAERCLRLARLPAQSFAAALRRIDVLRLVEGGVHALPEAQRLLDAELSDEQRADVLALLVGIHMSRGHGEPALQAAQARLEVLNRDTGAALRDDKIFQATCHVAQTLVSLGRHAQALETLDTVAAAVEAGDEKQKFLYFNARGAAQYACGPIARAIEAFERARIHVRALHDNAELHTVTANLCIARLTAGDADAALALAREAVDISDAMPGALLPRTVDRLNLGMCCVASGRFAEALPVLEYVAAQSDARSLWQLQAQTLLGLLWLRLGQAAKAMRALGDPLDDAAVPPLARAMRHAARVELAQARGEVGDEALAAALAHARAAGHRILQVLALAAQVAREPKPEALAALETLREESLRTGARVAAAVAGQAMADVLARRGEREAAYALALDVWRGSLGADGALVYRPALLWKLARSLRALGDEETAAAAERSACEWVRSRVLENLPAHFMEACLRRNPVHVALRVAARG